MLIIDQKNILWIFNNFNSLAFDFLFRFCLSKLWMNSKLVVPSHILSWSKNGMRRLQSGKNWVRKYLHWIQPDIVLGIWQFLSQWFVVNHRRNNKKKILYAPHWSTVFPMVRKCPKNRSDAIYDHIDQKLVNFN